MKIHDRPSSGCERDKKARNRDLPDPLFDPGGDVSKHLFLADVVQEVVVMHLVDLQRLVAGAGMFVEELAAVTDGGPVLCPVKDQDGQGNASETVTQPLVDTGKSRDGGCWLRLIQGQGIGLENRECRGVAREVLHVQRQDTKLRGDMTERPQKARSRGQGPETRSSRRSAR